MWKAVNGTGVVFTAETHSGRKELAWRAPLQSSRIPTRTRPPRPPPRCSGCRRSRSTSRTWPGSPRSQDGKMKLHQATNLTGAGAAAAPCGAFCSACSSSCPCSAWPWERRPARWPDTSTDYGIDHDWINEVARVDPTGRLGALRHGAQHEPRAGAAGDGQVRRHRAQDEPHGPSSNRRWTPRCPRPLPEARGSPRRGSGLGVATSGPWARFLPLAATGGSRTRRAAVLSSPAHRPAPGWDWRTRSNAS